MVANKPPIAPAKPPTNAPIAVPITGTTLPTAAPNAAPPPAAVPTLPQSTALRKPVLTFPLSIKLSKAVWYSSLALPNAAKASVIRPS